MSAVHVENDLWREYRKRLFGFVLRRVADPATAEDIVHDVLVRAYAGRDTLRSAQRFEPWLYRITRNAVVDHYRAQRPAEPLPPDLAIADPSTDGQAMHELAACMRPLLNTLPEPYRDALALAELQGLTQQQVATRLGLSLSGAKSRVQRGRRMLEGKLLDCCRIELDSRGSVMDYDPTNGCAPGGSAGGCGGC